MSSRMPLIVQILHRSSWQVSLSACLVLAAAILSGGCAPSDERAGDKPGAVSEFGKYEGYSEPVYDEWVRSSQYVPMRDGVRLAVDIIRPAKDGIPVEDPLPAVWSHRRYHRAYDREGQVISVVDRDPTLETLVRHGYVIVAVDARGTGASFGHCVGAYSEEETRDAFEMTEWLASRPWCDGAVGMYGVSYMGINQLMAAGTQPPHLEAVFPSMVGLDNYNLFLPGGVVRTPMAGWGEGIKRLDLEVPGVRVDADETGALLSEAMDQHRQNRFPEFEKYRYRDSREGMDWLCQPVTSVKEISKSGVPMYIWGGWYDIYARDAFQWYANLKNPKKLAVGVWAHRASVLNTEERLALQSTEQLRWFDHWLKGIDNGIMDEPPIHFAARLGEKDWTWRSAETWPLADVEPVTYYFGSGPTGTVASVNDGGLVRDAPAEDALHDTYIADYTTTSGRTSRWFRAQQMSYPDMTDNDARGLTFTTAPLEEDLTVTGHPVVTLWVTSTAEDGDFHVHLEEVDAGGVSHYVTEGVLRASHRAMSEPPFDNMELPYHRSFEADIQPLPKGEPAALVFDLLPTSNLFDSGNRIRVTITCADADNAEVLPFSPPPEVTLYRNREHASNIVLPVVRGQT